MINCSLLRSLQSSEMASRLIEVAMYGSRSQAGAPTMAARGIMTSASLTSGLITDSSRTSPWTKSKSGLAQRWKKPLLALAIQEVVHRLDPIARVEQVLAKNAAEIAGAAGYQNVVFHLFLQPRLLLNTQRYGCSKPTPT